MIFHGHDKSCQKMCVLSYTLSRLTLTKDSQHVFLCMYCIDSTFALQSCVYTQASLVPLPHRVPP